MKVHSGALFDAQNEFLVGTKVRLVLGRMVFALRIFPWQAAGRIEGRRKRGTYDSSKTTFRDSDCYIGSFIRNQDARLLGLSREYLPPATLEVRADAEIRHTH